jgi:xanthine dehydrogenase accessory factor
MRPDWLQALYEARARGEAAVLVVVAAVRGSAPREPGARLVVARTAASGAVTATGTIGGGHLELQAIGIARDLLAADTPGAASRSTRRFALGASLGQCCGGAVELLFDPVPAAAAWPDAVDGALAAGVACAVVTPVRAGGAADNRLVVTADGFAGTHGSTHGPTHGAASAATAAVAPAAIALAHARLADPLAPAAALVRAGAEPGATARDVTWFIDVLRPADFHVVLFGAGHVGRALAPVLAPIVASLTWVDERAGEFPASVASNVRCVATDAPDGIVCAARPGTWFAVMTHSHALDQALTEAILRRDDYAWFGLIGSRTKRRLFEQRLAARGIAAAQLAKLACPIGIDGIDGKAPATVALSIAAQMVQEHERRAARFGAAAAADAGVAATTRGAPPPMPGRSRAVRPDPEPGRPWKPTSSTG